MAKFFLVFVLTATAYGFQVYDCFLFFNELEILKIRLYEMAPLVDKFVLVESRETFRGNPKPLYFEENKHLFAEYLPKIIHVVIDEHFETDIPFHREQWQRNQIIRGLVECRDDDIVFISDVDEIVRRTMIGRMYAPLLKNKVDFVTGAQRQYNFFLNRFYRLILGTVATTYKHVRRMFPEEVRWQRAIAPYVENAGWHFSSIGSPQNYIKKIEAYSLVDRDTPEVKNLERIVAEMRSGPFEKIDKSFPLLVQENENYYRSIDFIRTP